MPVQVPTIDDEIAYILQYWIQNNVQAITGTIGQNVVWNLAQFIKKNPENWDKATVIADANINYTTTSSECVIIFTNNSAGSIDFGNNIWNKWYFVNGTGNTRTIAGGKFYYDINGVTQTSIAARSTVYIARGEDDFWYEVVNTAGGSGSSVTFSQIQFTIGDVDSPMVQGEDELIITVGNAKTGSVLVFLEGSLLMRGLSDQISYTVIYSSTEITINFNQGVINDQIYFIQYATD